MKIRLRLRMLSGSNAGQLLDVPVRPLVTIGRGDECDVVLSGWNVAKVHARLSVNLDVVFIEGLTRSASPDMALWPLKTKS